MPFYYNGTLGGEGSGSIPDPSVYGGRQLAVIRPNTAHLPSSPSDLVKNNYVIVDRNLDDSVFPFTIDSVTFLSKYDSAIYNGSQWELQSGIQNTQSVRVVDSTNESISGNATTQQEANIEFTNEIKDLKTRSFRTIGYCGTTQPSQAREDDIFYQTNATSSYGSDLPTNFPIQVYRWNNGAWSANTENWTPDVNDVIININVNPPIAFVWQNGWSPTTQGLSKTDNISIDRNNNGELQVKDGGITFLKLDPNAVATQNENSHNKVVRADAMYNTAITKNVSQIKTKTGGGKEIEIDLQNEANVSKTKVNIDLDETATQNSNNPIISNGVWKEKLNNTNSSFVCAYNSSSNSVDATLQILNNLNEIAFNKTIRILTKQTNAGSLTDNDYVSFTDLDNLQVKNITGSAVNAYIQSKIEAGNGIELSYDQTTQNRIITSKLENDIDNNNTETGKAATPKGVYDSKQLMVTIQPQNPVEGQVYYDTTKKQAQAFNGSIWLPMGVDLVELWSGDTNENAKGLILSDSVDNYKCIVICNAISNYGEPLFVPTAFLLAGFKPWRIYNTTIMGANINNSIYYELSSSDHAKIVQYQGVSGASASTFPKTKKIYGIR